MSNESEGPREADQVRAERVAATGFVGLLLFGAGAIWAAAVQTHASGSVRSGAASGATRAGEPEIGMVYQRPFEGAPPGAAGGIAAARGKAARERLESLGWVDRDAGVAHIPIEQAMELVVRGGAL